MSRQMKELNLTLHDEVETSQPETTKKLLLKAFGCGF